MCRKPYVSTQWRYFAIIQTLATWIWFAVQSQIGLCLQVARPEKHCGRVPDTDDGSMAKMGTKLASMVM